MDDRRRYFRIDDEVLLAYRILKDDELGEFRRGTLRARIRRESVQELLFHLDTRFETLNEKLKALDPTVREAIEIMDRKLNLLERWALQHNDDNNSASPVHQLVKANLSACGLAMTTSEAVEVGQHIALDLILLPDYDQLELVSKVVSVREEESPHPYVVGIEFVDLREDDRDLIARHVMRRQTTDLRETRNLSVS